jgi:hypothetical protein
MKKGKINDYMFSFFSDYSAMMAEAIYVDDDNDDDDDDDDDDSRVHNSYTVIGI